jgi:hypothetical protein
MKHLLLTISAVCILSVYSHGQGFVFANSSTTKISTNGAAPPSVGMTGGTAISGNSSPGTAYMFAAYQYDAGSGLGSTNSGPTPGVAAPLQPWLNANWTLIGYATNTSGSGRLYDSSDASGVLPSVADQQALATYANLMVIGWNIAVGGTTIQTLTSAYGTAAGLYYGASSDGSIAIGNGTTPPYTTIIGTGAGNIPAFTLGLVPVPEPGTMALAALSGASLLLFRRRK